MAGGVDVRAQMGFSFGGSGGGGGGGGGGGPMAPGPGAGGCGGGGGGGMEDAMGNRSQTASGEWATRRSEEYFGMADVAELTDRLSIHSLDFDMNATAVQDKADNIHV
jgi:hypothetical protein